MTENTPVLHLIRHAESQGNLLHGRVNGRQNNLELTPRGEQQAARLGRWLVTHRVEPARAFSSPAIRARHTARFVLHELGTNLQALHQDALQEMDQGLWTGRVRREVHTPRVLADIQRLGIDFRAPRGESMREAGERMYGWLETVPSKGTTLAFSHGMAIRCLVGRLLNWNGEQVYTAATPNTSLTTLKYTEGEWSVEAVGAVPHLPEVSSPAGQTEIAPY